MLTPAMEARVLKWTSRKPTDGSTHWTTRKLGRKLGISHTQVATVWKRANLKPHRIERYMASNDPDFETKAADVIGLYVNPPQHAAVFCVDEKTAIQALDRLDQALSSSLERRRRILRESCADGCFGRVERGWGGLDGARLQHRETHCFQCVSLDFIGCGGRI